MRHSKVTTIADMTQAKINEGIIRGQFPSGTTTNDIALSSDWNAAHVLDVTTQTGTSYTLQSSDNGTAIRFTSNSAVTLTCPNNLTAGFNVGILQIGSGQITPTAASGATVANAHSFTKTYGINAAASLIVDANSDGVSAHYIFGGDCA